MGFWPTNSLPIGETSEIGMRLFSLVLAAMALAGSPAFASEAQEDLKTCINPNPPDAVIASCTRVAADLTFDASKRGGALFFRALAKERKQDTEGAMA